MVLRRGTGRGGPRALPASDVFCGSHGPRRRTGRTTAEGADGSSACPGDSSHERGDAGTNSHPWDIQQADKSIRVRNAGEDLLPRPVRLSGFSTLSWAFPVCRFLSNGARVPRMTLPKRRHTGCSHAKHAGAAGAVFRPAFRMPRWGEGTGLRRRAPRRDENRGDDARLLVARMERSESRG